VTWRRVARRAPRSKYSNVKTVRDGIRFDSKREADRYDQLRLLAIAGHITNLQVHPTFELHALGGLRVGKYIADFAYRDERTQRLVVEDVKGVQTAVFRLKSKMVKAEHGIEVQCV
jgi:hypothetical protein